MLLWDRRSKSSNQKVSDPTLVLISDTCYSGAWVDWARLHRPKLLIQASAAADEQAYDHTFISSWMRVMYGMSTRELELQKLTSISSHPSYYCGAHSIPVWFPAFESRKPSTKSDDGVQCQGNDAIKTLMQQPIVKAEEPIQLCTSSSSLLVSSSAAAHSSVLHNSALSTAYKSKASSSASSSAHAPVLIGFPTL
jgi:hypothetical protein